MENVNFVYTGLADKPKTLVKRTVQTIEKYDAQGNFMGREIITKEEDEYWKDTSMMEIIDNYNIPQNHSGVSAGQTDVVLTTTNTSETLTIDMNKTS